MGGLRKFHESRLQVAQIKSLILDAQAHQASGNTENVISDYSKVVDLDPDDLDARILLGNALAAAQQTDRARQVYKDLIQRAPKFAEAYNNRGLLALPNRKREASQSGFRTGDQNKASLWPCPLQPRLSS